MKFSRFQQAKKERRVNAFRIYRTGDKAHNPAIPSHMTHNRASARRSASQNYDKNYKLQYYRKVFSKFFCRRGVGRTTKRPSGADAEEETPPPGEARGQAIATHISLGEASCRCAGAPNARPYCLERLNHGTAPGESCGNDSNRRMAVKYSHSLWFGGEARVP